MVFFYWKNFNKKENIEVDVSPVDKNRLAEVEKMTLREKIAQMLVVYYNSSTVDNNLLDSLETNQPGGFIIADKNYSTYEDTRKFVEKLAKSTKIPMLISTDEEGGFVQRTLLINDTKATRIPDMASIGKINNDELSYGIGKIIAEKLRSLGINMTYAPVIDLGNKDNSPLKTRIISNDASVLSQVEKNISRGILDNGVIPVYKHFPGIADTKIDTHDDLPSITKTKEELYNYELKPFIEAIKNGAEVIMLGHVRYPKLDPSNNASSLSKAIITDLLRKELGFTGLVTTDAINMGALTKNYSDEEIFELGIKAGVDQFLMPKSSKEARDIIEGLVKEGKIKEKRIDQSVERILKLKRKYLKDYKTLPKEYLNHPSHQELLSKYNLYKE